MPIADAFPTDPPSEWFLSPPSWFEVGMKASLVTEGPEAGRFAATVAPRDVCIVDGSGKCWTAPRSPSAYAEAMQGDVVTASGEVLKAATIAMDVNHVDGNASYGRAVDVMANTGAAVARVRYYDTDDGVIALGAVYPGIDDLRLRRFQASALSGDWRMRPETGAFDFAGSIAVNTPGFPIPNRPVFQPVAMAASLGAPPVVFGNWLPEEALMLKDVTVTCGSCGGLTTAPARAAAGGTVVVSAPTPCSCRHAAAAPFAPAEEAPEASGGLDALKAEVAELRAAVDEISAMVMDREMADVDAMAAALPEPVTA